MRRGDEVYEGEIATMGYHQGKCIEKRRSEWMLKGAFTAANNVE